ncbi:MAG TPA: thymidylate kinase [Candidatus Latescibacteria bacterium]|nr:MAG: Thymidylate kinase [Candidatus Latescibacteria bacterium ADurb.Bin168]HPU85259.1 thymidylate kinase [Candidatus Latescibacterota bacterium]
MAKRRFMGTGLPYVDLSEVNGHLLVVEGSDGVGRTTQLSLLRTWLEVQGYGVIETGWTRSALVRESIDLAKAGNALNLLTFNLLYATDFADRLEHEIIPALRSGFVVLADRYVYTAFARALARGTDPEWIRRLYGIAIEPDLVVYLRVDVNTLIHRVLLADSLDHWEAGLDQYPQLDPYESFIKYQSDVIKEFDKMSDEYGFTVIDARKKVDEIQRELRAAISATLGQSAGADVVAPTVDE